MQQQKIHSESEPDPGGVPPLPLFRPEALESRQQRLYGDILLIRPFSLTLLAGIAIVLAAGAVGFLLLGHHTQKIKVTGSLVPMKTLRATASPAPSFTGILHIPHQVMPFVREGQQIVLRCPACTQQSLWPRPAVIQLSLPTEPFNFPDAKSQSIASANETMDPVFVKLERLMPALPQEAITVEVDVPVARESLLKWLFARPQARQEVSK